MDFINSNRNVICFSAFTVKMSDDAKWQLEMKSMLDIVEEQSEISLRSINQCFQALNRTFTEEFKQYFLKMTNQRYTFLSKERSLYFF